MSQRSFFLVAVLLLLLVGGLAAVIVVLARQEPGWYAAAEIPRGERMEKLNQLLQTSINLQRGVTEDREWGGQVTDYQINSCLEEGFIGLDQNYEDRLPEDISDPRVSFEQDRIKLAFRYGHGAFSSVVSIELRVWLPANEPNVVALELERFRAGALPISAQSLLEQLAELGRKKHVDVGWYRYKGRPVALVRLQPDQPRPTIQLQALHLTDHTLMIQGRSLDQPARPSEAAPAFTQAAP